VSSNEVVAPVPAIHSGQQTLTLDHLQLSDDSSLAPVTLAYETWGTLAPGADNVVLVCHALTGSAHACDLEAPDDPRAGWWNPLIGPGRLFDTRRYFVICSNVLGGCYGSSGPTSPHPADGRPYGMRFPLIGISDMVRAQRALLEQLGIRRLAVVTGGSIGGQQALEWAVAYPDFVERVIVLAAGARLSAQGIALNEIGRQAILSDPRWQGGDYLPGQGPDNGLAIARMVAMLSYTSAADLEARFGRRPASRPLTTPTLGDAYDVESYLHYQGMKLVRRFDANTYLILSRAMDRYDLAEGPGRGSDAAALARVRASLLAVGISSDWLFPAAQVRAVADGIRAAGGQARYAEMESPLGHDAFLKEWTQLEAILRAFLHEQTEQRAPHTRAIPGIH
jgi:homoserine O-acetyltransferase